MGHSGHPVDPVGQYKRVGTRLLVQHQRGPAGPRTWDLGSWGDGELGTLNPVCLDTSYLLVVRDTRLLMHVTAINCM